MDKSFDVRQGELLECLSKVRIDDFGAIAIDKILFNVSGTAIQYSINRAIKDIFKRLVSNSYEYSSRLIGNDLVMLTYDYKRIDHTESWKQEKNLFDNYDEIFLGDSSFSKNKLLSFKEIISSLNYQIKYMNQLKQVSSMKERGVLAAHLVELRRLLDTVKDDAINGKVVMTFFDGGSYENLLIQFLRSKGMKAITLQHGQPVFHGKSVDRINQTMILNFSSDYVIVPGEFSKKQFVMGGVLAESVFVGGSLKQNLPYKDKKTGWFSVFLDCPTYTSAFEDNCKMIEMAKNLSEKLKLHFFIKLHPQDSVEKYSEIDIGNGTFVKKEITPKEVIIDSEFSILHASGVYLDVISSGCKAYCFVTDMIFPLVEYEDDKFSSYNELIYKLKKWRMKSKTEKEAYIGGLVEYYLHPNDSSRKHKEFVQKLINRSEF